MAIAERRPTAGEAFKIATYPIRHPGLAAHDLRLERRIADEEKHLVPGKIEEVRPQVLEAGITHLGLITDKSGTWAELRGLPRSFGYRRSARHATNTVVRAKEVGLRDFTVWIASPENIDNRSAEAMQAVYEAVEPTVVALTPELRKNGGKLVAKGRTERLPGSLHDVLEKAQRETEGNGEYSVNLYVDANNENDEMALLEGLLMHQVIDPLTRQPITPDLYLSQKLSERRRLYQILSKETQILPDVDVLIRTGMEPVDGYTYTYLSRWGRSAQNTSVYPLPEPLPELRVMTVLNILSAASHEERRHRKAGGLNQHK